GDCPVQILSFEEVNQGFTRNNAFANTIINKDNSPDYRSPFHDYKNTPLGYSYLTDDPVSVFPSTGINEKGEKGYEYRAAVLPCENGSQVLGSYNDNKREPQSLFLFYEKSNPDKSNFAGDFYAAKMGDYFVQLFKRFPEPLPSSVGGKFFRDITSLEDEAAYLAQLAYTYEGDKINATLVRDALMREYQFYTNNKQFDELLGNISQIPADAIGWCAAQLEDFKPDERNYDPASKDYSPLIPVFAGATVSENMNKAAEFFEDLDSNPFVQGIETAFSQVWELVKQSADKVKDASIDHLPDSFKKLVTRITGIINTIKTFLSEIKDIVTDMADKGIEFLKILNAFLCGIINGLVSLVQCILYILEFLLQPTTTFSYQQYLERRDLLEKAEDVLDWVYENMPVFLEGVKNLFSSSVNISQSDFENIFDQLKEYWDKASRYTIAFYTGLIAFEFIINILLLIFTAGEGNVVKGATYVQKASSLLRILVREAFSAATFGLTDLLLGLGKLMLRFSKACAKGFTGFIKFIEELLQGAKNGAKAEDLAEEAQDIEEVIIKAKPKKLSKIDKEIEEIYRKQLLGSGGGKKFTRKGLQKMAKLIEEKYADIGLKVEIVTKRSHPERYKAWTTYPKDILASCRTHEIPPKMFLRYDATELTLQHEVWHIDDFKKLGFDEYHNTPNWKLEELVWERVWKTKQRWTEEELLDSYEYYQWSCRQQGAEYKSVEELDKLLK
ncbi:zincin-like metallopeptidase toxin domain-containing protein, partial [Flavobacterium sp. B17]|uniref:zincin-like metallopeptidase toxin domain-containing protein n=1 Tax=Flavobacterium sp. B17 TaxID=95618 RepID=UPI0005B289C0